MADERDRIPAWQRILTLGLVVAARAFGLMLAFGVLHNDWTPEIPALGFWACLALAFAIPMRGLSA